MPFIFEVRDLWPESLVAVGVGDANSPLHRVLGKIAGFLYSRADLIVVVTSSFKEHLIEKWQVAPEKISVIENEVETELFNPAKSNPMLRRELSAEGKFVVGYIGTIGLAHGLETLLQAASELRETSPNVLFLIVGEGADKQRVMDLAAAQKLDNIRFVGQQPRNKIPEFILACHLSLVLLKSTDVFKTVIPTKMLEFMSCERPVIVGVDGEARRIVEEGEAGLFIRPENGGGSAQAFRRFGIARFNGEQGTPVHCQTLLTPTDGTRVRRGASKCSEIAGRNLTFLTPSFRARKVCIKFLH
ncbi:MAG: hypothetical protein NVS1B11_05700 [Terriglobales bacterium]